MVNRQLVTVRTVSFFHALLSAYFLAAALLIFIPHFYPDHIFLHIFVTVSLVITFIIQRTYKGCPITTLERNILAKIDKKEAKAFSNSFIIYWVKKRTGITLPLKLVQSLIYINLILLAYSWLYLFIKI